LTARADAELPRFAAGPARLGVELAAGMADFALAAVAAACPAAVPDVPRIGEFSVLADDDRRVVLVLAPDADGSEGSGASVPLAQGCCRPLIIVQLPHCWTRRNTCDIDFGG
jgi:hypothetical protein